MDILMDIDAENYLQKRILFMENINAPVKYPNYNVSHQKSQSSSAHSTAIKLFPHPCTMYIEFSLRHLFRIEFQALTFNSRLIVFCLNYCHCISISAHALLLTLMSKRFHNPSRISSEVAYNKFNSSLRNHNLS